MVGVALAVGLVLGPLRGLIGGCGFAPSGGCLRVLFIGNSYTSVNDLPATFAALARSAGVAVDVRMVAPGGQTLAGHDQSAETHAAIDAGPWTAVVLQEQSQIPAASDLRDTEMIPPGVSLASRVERSGARVYLFETWAHQDGWPERGLDRAGMQAAVTAAYRELAAAAGAVVVPVGSAWADAAAAVPGVALWQSDGSHPTVAGTYLAACVFFRVLVGRSPVGLGETNGLLPSTAAALQRVTEETIP